MIRGAQSSAEPPNDQNARDRLVHAVRSGQIGAWSTAAEKAERLLLGIENRALSVWHGCAPCKG
ncbi:hypothetical protein, partial [Sphingobium sp. C100]|uniref:hypothetical protein n=1 Tax=Sphingobium sp. C100 TaxID=1207055 RepID=UPI0004CF6117